MRTVTHTLCTKNMLFLQNKLCLLACLLVSGCAAADNDTGQPAYSLPPMTKVKVSVSENGQNKSVIVRDRNNPGTVSGYIHIPILSGAEVPVTTAYVNDLNGLARSVALLTGITATIDPALSLSDPRILAYPFLYLRLTADRLTGPELEVLGAYLNGTGFLILDSSRAEEIVRSFEGVVTRRVPADHAIYTSPFPIDVGVIRGTGIFHGDMLVGIVSHSFGATWDSPEKYDRQIKRAINCLVYTMGRER